MTVYLRSHVWRPYCFSGFAGLLGNPVCQSCARFRRQDAPANTLATFVPVPVKVWMALKPVSNGVHRLSTLGPLVGSYLHPRADEGPSRTTFPSPSLSASGTLRNLCRLLIGQESQVTPS
jgi:hypothetical protein